MERFGLHDRREPGLPQPGRHGPVVEQPQGHLGIKKADLEQRNRIKTGDDHLIVKIAILDQRQQSFHLIPTQRVIRFDFDINQAAIPDQIKDFI